MTKALRVGTRASLLALTQTRIVTEQVARVTGREIQEIQISTEGDQTVGSLMNPKRPGVFVSALRDALLAGDVDFIVHSFKDLPSAADPRIALAAVPVREDFSDVLVSRDGLTLAQLPAGAVVGTSSPRREARVRHLRPDVVVKPMRGNVDTRLRKIQEGEFDAAVLAAAGLSRLGLIDQASEYMSLDQIIPAPAQGALAIECLAENVELVEQLGQLTHFETRITTAAERAVLAGVAASCTTAIGAHAIYFERELELVAEISHPTQDRHERVALGARALTVEDALTLGLQVAKLLLATELGQEILDA